MTKQQLDHEIWSVTKQLKDLETLKPKGPSKFFDRYLKDLQSQLVELYILTEPEDVVIDKAVDEEITESINRHDQYHATKRLCETLDRLEFIDLFGISVERVKFSFGGEDYEGAHFKMRVTYRMADGTLEQVEHLI